MNRSDYLNLSLILLISLYLLVVIKTAWVSDDAYITFKTVSNFASGNGLTWNITERVQAYTHPLWMILVGVCVYFTHEFYLTSISISILLSTATVIIFSRGIAQSVLTALLGILIFTLSNSFIDYSTSGLENPLSNLLIVLFLYVYFKFELSPKTIFFLSLIASLGILNRADLILVFFPVLIYVLWQKRSKRGLLVVFLGSVPFILWEIFSIIYYGFPFPNTAYAKLNTSISANELIQQGTYYFIDSLIRDPLTLLIIFVGLVSILILKTWKNLPIVIGVGLYLVYILRIGGDFMSGRFFSAPLLIAVILLSRRRLQSFVTAIPELLLVVLIGLSSPTPTVLSNHTYGKDESGIGRMWGIENERAAYYPVSGLLMTGQGLDLPRHKFVYEGLAARDQGVKVETRAAIGFFGFYVGREVHVIDLNGLADPLLARLPPKRDPHWRIGHFRRLVPEGYKETLAQNQNLISNQNLSLYYEKLSRVVKGDVWNWERFVEIWKLNTGVYDHLIDSYMFEQMVHTNISEIPPYTDAEFTHNDVGNIVFNANGVAIHFVNSQFAKEIVVDLTNNRDYLFFYYLDNEELTKQSISLWALEDESIARFTLDVPGQIVTSGFDRIEIYPHDVGVFILGYFELQE